MPFCVSVFPRRRVVTWQGWWVVWHTASVPLSDRKLICQGPSSACMSRLRFFRAAYNSVFPQADVTDTLTQPNTLQHTCQEAVLVGQPPPLSFIYCTKHCGYVHCCCPITESSATQWVAPVTTSLHISLSRRAVAGVAQGGWCTT